jgi:hypothetical protein
MDHDLQRIAGTREQGHKSMGSYHRNRKMVVHPSSNS